MPFLVSGWSNLTLVGREFVEDSLASIYGLGYVFRAVSGAALVHK
jgi:hypothetical protein